MKSIFITLILSFFTLLSANIVIGSVSSLSGIVKVKSEGSIKKSKIKLGQELNEGDLVTTSKKSKIVIKLVDGSSIVLDVSSSVHFAMNNSIEQNEGKVFYNIRSRNAKNSLKVKTPFAIIGIKGTIFVVNTNKGQQSISLKEGKIGVASIKEQFSLYRKEVLAKFNAYKDEQMKNFNKYKGIEEPKPEITSEFDLIAGHVISFEGNVVKESVLADSDNLEFGDFEDMLGSDWTIAKKLSSTMKDLDDEFSESSPSKEKNSELLNDVENSMNF